MNIEALPAHLHERSRVIEAARDGASHPAFVLYWMRTAVRAHDNPALDVALHFATQLGVPCFCYHGLSEHYPYASDRHHTFVLEGARDVAVEMRARGVGYAFHLERPGHRGPHLVTLAEAAGLVVTEDMPVSPLREWTRTLGRRAAVPVVAVDTACVLPMRLTPRPERAFRFRKATAESRTERIGETWVEVLAPTAPFVPEDLPFTPVDLASARIDELVAACDIDHGVGPVHDTRGGSRAGYDRWTRFRDERLDGYARDRNDPVLRAVSRLSAYLHYGMVSPFRIARQCVARGSAGADKFLDELLLWREMAYAFCFHEAHPDQLSALPRWARETLAAHARDPRLEHFSWETLARGKTGQALWDLAQHSLLRHGELHNNVRMTWGKALLQWTPSPAVALERLVDLNHRYALDGRDPASYGGLLWCLGLFDRPFEPEAPIRGSVRPRPIADHEARLSLDAYRGQVRRPAHDTGRVAVVGAGVAGLACARTLTDHGVDVVVFDKGRRVGGRLSTRRQAGRQFDHGAQFFAAKGAAFRRFVDSWRDDGIVADWHYRELFQREGAMHAEQKRRPVGAGHARRLAEHLAADLTIHLETRVAPLRAATRHALTEERGTDLGIFDYVVVTAPLAQAKALLAAHPHLVGALGEAQHAPCWALMVDFADPVTSNADVLRSDGPVAWAAREASRPERPESHAWILHADPEWSRSHLEEPAEVVASLMLAAFGELAGPLPATTFTSAHRWRYARVERAVGVPCLFDVETGIAVAGDGLLGPRVEAAWTSGVAAAGRILGAGPLIRREGSQSVDCTSE